MTSFQRSSRSLKLEQDKLIFGYNKLMRFYSTT